MQPSFVHVLSKARMCWRHLPQTWLQTQVSDLTSICCNRWPSWLVLSLVVIQVMSLLQTQVIQQESECWKEMWLCFVFNCCRNCLPLLPSLDFWMPLFPMADQPPLSHPEEGELVTHPLSNGLEMENKDHCSLSPSRTRCQDTLPSSLCFILDSAAHNINLNLSSSFTSPSHSCILAGTKLACFLCQSMPASGFCMMSYVSKHTQTQIDSTPHVETHFQVCGLKLKSSPKS